MKIVNIDDEKILCLWCDKSLVEWKKGKRERDCPNTNGGFKGYHLWRKREI